MLAKLLPVVLREILWLVGALLVAALLSVGLRLLLEHSPALHEPLLRELPAHAPFVLKLLLFGLCLLGIYVGRVAVATVDSLLEAEG